jgi:peptidoglycan/LPS O-acetylase OafA/YrhL
MTSTHLPREVRQLITISPIGLLLCAIGLVGSLWAGPRSPRYLMYTIVAGILATSFWLLYWKYRRDHAGAIIFLIFSIASLTLGYLLAFRLTFGYTHDINDLWLALQYGAIVLAILFGAVQIFRKYIERLVTTVEQDAPI